MSHRHLTTIKACFDEKRIIEINPNNNQTKKVVNNLNWPVHVNIMRSEYDILCLVTCHGTHTVDLYDEGWKLVRTFGGPGQTNGQMMHPLGTTFTKQGILVADQSNHRIRFYSIESKFIKHICYRLSVMALFIMSSLPLLIAI